jgi:hypothetical protein
VLTERQSGLGQLFDQDHLVQFGKPTAAEFDRPGNAQQPTAVKCPSPLRLECRCLTNVRDGADSAPCRRQFLRKCCLNLASKGLDVCGVADVHLYLFPMKDLDVAIV